MKTTVVNIHKTKKYDVYCGRGSKWGNPFTHIKDKETLAQFVVPTRAQAIASYKEWILTQQVLLDSLHELRGKVLGCFCKPKSCHCDTLAKLADQTNFHTIF